MNAKEGKSWREMDATGKELLENRLEHLAATETAANAADAALLASGEELLPMAKIGRKLGRPKGELLGIVSPLVGVSVRRTNEDPYRYCVKDVEEAVRLHMERLQGVQR